MNEIATFSEINFSSGDFISSFHDSATILALTSSENEYNYNHKHQSNLTSVRPDARLGLLLWPRENVCSHSPAMSRCRPGRPPPQALPTRSQSLSQSTGEGDLDITEIDITESAITNFQEIDITESDITEKGNCYNGI